MSWYFQAFVLWRLSLEVCCASSESQSSSGQISASISEQRDRGPFSTDVLATLTLFLLVLLNPAASRDVRPTPGVPALTSRAGASLSFVFLTLPVTLFQCGSRTPELWFLDWSRVFPGSWSLSYVSQGCGSVSPACSPAQVATASQRPNMAVPSPFHLSSDICGWFHSSPLRTSVLSAGDVHL